MTKKNQTEKIKKEKEQTEKIKKENKEQEQKHKDEKPNSDSKNKNTNKVLESNEQKHKDKKTDFDSKKQDTKKPESNEQKHKNEKSEEKQENTNSDLEIKDNNKTLTWNKKLIIILIICIALFIGAWIYNEINNPTAATVGNQKIYESTVNQEIATIMQNNNISDLESWKSLLASKNYTAEQLREEIIQSLIGEMAIEQEVIKRNIQVSDEKVEAIKEVNKKTMGGEEAFNNSLKSMNATEEDYNRSIKNQLKIEELGRMLANEENNKYVDQAIINNFSTSIDGSVEFYMLPIDNQQEAEEILAGINNGTIDFYKKLEEYADTNKNLANKYPSYSFLYQSQEVPNYLKELGVGSYNLKQEENYWIIYYVTQIISAPNPLQNVNDLPEELANNIRESIKANAPSLIIAEALDDIKNDIGYKINPIPENTSYNVS